MSVLAGTQVFISSSTPSTNNVAGFSAIPYTQINGVMSVSEIAERQETYTQNVIGSALNLVKKTGKTTYSPVTFEIYKINANAGQLLILNSVSGNYSYKIVEPTGAITYFVAQTVEVVDGEKSPTSFARTTIRLELQNRVVRA